MQTPRLQSSDQLCYPEAKKFLQYQWQLMPDLPVLHPPKLSPMIADPTFLLPQEAPDGLFHLFCHSAFGIEHYLSPDGFQFVRQQCRIPHGMRPFLWQEEGLYYLFYEDYQPLNMLSNILPQIKWHSRICMRSSFDLRNWSTPQTVLSPSLPWHRNKRGNDSLGNPSVCKKNGQYYLFYSASLVLLRDCGFNEPEHIGLAVSSRITGPYAPLAQPLLSPRTDDPDCNLSAGSVKIKAVKDGFIGLQNGIYSDAAGNTYSAIRPLTLSENLTISAYPPVIKPGAAAFMERYCYAFDFKPYADGLLLYFNCRNKPHWKDGREYICRVIGKK